MNKYILTFIITILFFTILLIIVFPKENSEINKTEQTKTLSANSKHMSEYKTTPEYNIIREPAVAGQFYPKDKNELITLMDSFLNKVELPHITGTPQILILPHAGYVFSGQTASYGFKAIENSNYDNIIIIGPSHNFPISDFILYDGDAVKTPLGLVAINKNIVNELLKNQNIKADNSIHQPEHSLEVEIPFLQHLFKNDFQLTLGLVNAEDLSKLESIANSIEKVLEQHPNTLIIISSDLSHYPNYDDAIYSDNKIIQSILTKDAQNLTNSINSVLSENRPGLETCACGNSAIKIGMFLAKKLNLKGQKLYYSNSGETPVYGDKNKVVGYGAIVFTADNTLQSINNEQATSTIDRKLNSREKQVALKLAQNTLEVAFGLSDNKFKDYKNYPIFSENRGVFVTLYKDGQLRGCIGLIEPIKPLAEGIIEMAQAAAFNDHRFTPLTKKELENTEIEISVLTPPQKINNLNQIELGKHGVIVRFGNNSGVYLPQVATETGWDLETFMSSLCSQKAGLPANCWQNNSTAIYTFEAQVFGEK